MILGCQPEPCRKVATRSERLGRRRLHTEHRRPNRTDARNCRSQFGRGTYSRRELGRTLMCRHWHTGRPSNRRPWAPPARPPSSPQKSTAVALPRFLGTRRFCRYCLACGRLFSRLDVLLRGPALRFSQSSARPRSTGKSPLAQSFSNLVRPLLSRVRGRPVRPPVYLSTPAGGAGIPLGNAIASAPGRRPLLIDPAPMPPV